MIRLRDDDVVIKHSSQWEDIFGRFRQVHEWTKAGDGQLLHVCAILADDLQTHSEAISYIRDEVEAGNIEPQIHGKEHIDYANLSKEKVREHLKYCKDFIFESFSVIPTLWYTPWGASSPHLHEVSLEENIKLIDCSKIIPIESCVKSIRYGVPVRKYEGKEVITHFWNKGLRVKRLAVLAKYGSWGDAVEAEPRLFR